MRKLSLFILILVLSNYSAGYESFLLFEKGINDNIKIFNVTNPLDVNPAMLSFFNRSDTTVLILGLLNTDFGFKRFYDPENVLEYKFTYKNFKTINDRNIIASVLSYYHSEFVELNRSLEKSFYDNYFPIIDTTIGNISYKGPLLSFADAYWLNRNLIAGFLVNYGIERSLKDVYTKCETIARNIDFSIGVGVKGKRNFATMFIRYLNNQRKYESVKEFQDALIRTFYGFHIYKIEEPGSSKKKNYNSKGWELGGNIKLNILKNYSLFVSSSGGIKQANIKVSSGNIMRPRGNWARQGFFINIGIVKKSGSISSGLSYYKRYMSSWAESSVYKVLILEDYINEEFINSQFEVLKKDKHFGIDIGFGKSNVEYSEYNSSFNFIKTLNKFKIEINSVLYLRNNFDIKLNYFISIFDTDFRWESNRIYQNQLKVALSRLGIYGNIKTQIYFEGFKALKSNNKIFTSGVEFIIEK